MLRNRGIKSMGRKTSQTIYLYLDLSQLVSHFASVFNKTIKDFGTDYGVSL